MIYFSELKDKKVYTEDKVVVGILEDLIFTASEKPAITKLVVRNNFNNKLIIPIEFVLKLKQNINLKKGFQTANLDENELFLLKNIQDKQIIDLQGNKIVRVNDIAIQDEDGFYIAGVETGLLGILRWLKLERIFSSLISYLHLKPTLQFLSWADIQPLELARGQVKLKKVEPRLEKLRPEDLADYLEKTNLTNIKKILNILDDKFAASVFSDLNINFQSALFKQFTPEKATRVLDAIDPDEAVDVLLSLSAKKRDQIINLLSENKKRAISKLLRLSHTPIGELITTEYLAVRSGDTVANVIKKVKLETSDFSYLPTIYALNDDNQLIGVFSLHRLILQDLSTPIYKFMVQNIIVIHLSTPVEIAIRKMLKYKLSALPVIDSEKHLIGIVTIDDVAEFLLKKI